MSALLALTLAVVCLTPLHAAHTLTLNLPHVEQGRFFSLPKPTSFEIRVGDELPVYRFYEDFKPELGRARVVEAEPGRLRCELITESFIYNVGRHGIVERRAGDYLFVQMGREHGLQPGMLLNLFEEQTHIAQVRVVMPAVDGNATLVKIGRHSPRAREIFTQDPEAAAGLGVSEFTVPTSVILFSHQRWVIPLEIAVVLLVLALELHLQWYRGVGLIATLGRSAARVIRARPAPFALAFSVLLVWPLASFAEAMLMKFGQTPGASLPWIVGGVLFVLQLGLFVARWRPGALVGLTLSAPLYYLLASMTVLGTRWLIGNGAVRLLRALPGGLGDTLGPSLIQAGGAIPLDGGWVLAAVFYLAHLVLLIRGKDHLPVILWSKLRYRPRSVVQRVTKHEARQRALVWMLHLAVLYAFAFALIGFLGADVNQMLDFVTPNTVTLRIVNPSLADPSTIPRWIRATAHNVGLFLSTGPASLSFDQWLTVLRLGVWAVTIVGCLVGYVHSLVHVLHKTTIRNVDFTLAGWFVNAICYPPLLGWLFWTVAPYPYGTSPEVAQGPLLYVLLITEMLFNVMYTASVWNLGTKFGVMVDKGLVDHGFYAAVRHPSYTLEGVMMFLIALKTVHTPAQWAGAALPILLYWLRSERDEDFMAASNPDYAAYRQRVPYKFIPGLW
jgi:protein-S-isoprenylcysteine O-methyltransferase Ste14